MNKNLATTALAIILTGCSYNKVSNSGDSLKADTTLTYDGIWAENEEDNALFIIKGDSVQNVEHGDEMYFEVVEDTMTIDYGDFKGKYFVLKFTKDSLILRNPDKSVTRLYRR